MIVSAEDPAWDAVIRPHHQPQRALPWNPPGPHRSALATKNKGKISQSCLVNCLTRAQAR